MTGFARAEGAGNGFSWSWEIRSVNARNLDSRLRVPSGYDRLEAAVRTQVNERFRRGNISATLALTRDAGAGALRINRDVLDQVLALADELGNQIDAAPPRIDGLLSLRGVLEQAEEELPAEQRDRLETALAESFAHGLDELTRMRDEEGARLATVIEGHVGEITRLVAAAGKLAETQPETLNRRLREQLAELVANEAGLTEERIAQEVALLVAKADVREELDRLSAHLESARDLVGSDDAVGRRLDFLCQEFNREANTLCSKAADIELTRIGLDLKAAIEQLREQIQNIE